MDAHSASGNGPTNRLFERIMACDWVNRASSAGMVPVSRFSSTFSHFSAEALPKAGGNDPLSKLELSSRNSRVDRDPSNVGRLPLIRLADKNAHFNSEVELKLEGSGPEN